MMNVVGYHSWQLQQHQCYTSISKDICNASNRSTNTPVWYYSRSRHKERQIIIKEKLMKSGGTGTNMVWQQHWKNSCRRR